MLRFILRRLLWAIPTLLILTFVVYCALRLSTNPLASYARSNPRIAKQPKKMQQYIEVNGLWDGFGGYVRGYFHWLKGFLTGDWQPSIKGSRPVWPNLKDALINTLRLGIVASIFGIAVGLALGVFAGLRPGKLRDSAVNTGALIGFSIQPFISAVILQLLFSVQWAKWFGSPLLPTSGMYPPGHSGFDPILMLKYMILPVIVVSIQTIASYSRYMRASLLDVMSSDYLRTARAKGISERRVLVRHALRNALVPIVTIAALDMGFIVGGLIISEGIFDYPGMGLFFLTAEANGDFPELMPWMVIITASVILFNLLADLAYAWLDPRIRLD
ncbi:MAG: ABC transporter permease [Acidimicrobiales bacterium]